MADGQVDVKIFTADAVQNLADLKQVISDAKKNLSTLEIGSENYQAQLTSLIQAQNLLRGAMNGTVSSMETLQHEVDGTSKSYNALVNQMADLKRQFRAATDEATRADLGGRIREINEELKRMDAMKGDFQRNVGDYFNQTSAAMKDVIKDLPSGLDAIKGPLRDIEGTMGLMSKHPIIGIIGLLSPAIVKIVEGLKENNAALSGAKKAMDALKPLMDFLSGVLDNVVTYLGNIIEKAATFLSSNGVFQKVIQGVMGVGNAILKFVIAPFKGIAAAVKVFQEEGVKGLGNAARAFGAEMKAGVSFKENFQAGTFVADALVKGASSKKPGTTIGKEVKKDLEKELTSDDLAKIFETALAKAERKAAESLRQRQEKDSLIDSVTQTIEDEMNAEIDAYLEGERVMYETSVQMAQEAAEQKMAVMSAYASGSSDLLNGIADLMEASGNSDEKSVKVAKNLRIAAATIDMIQGAVTAYSTAQQLGPIAGPIVGAINAAAVVTSGLANIAKIKATTVSKESAPSQVAPETPATVDAPALANAVPTTTVVNGASTQAALNRAAQPQKVYILQSDIEAAGNAAQVQVAESSF